MTNLVVSVHWCNSPMIVSTFSNPVLISSISVELAGCATAISVSRSRLDNDCTKTGIRALGITGGDL